MIPAFPPASALPGVFKLRICSLITVSAVVGMVAASSGGLSAGRAAALAASTMLASSAAASLNHLFDRDVDSMMTRTRQRPVASACVRPGVVAFSALALLAVSMALSAVALNLMVSLHLALGVFVYVVVYTAWLKRRSSLNVVVGGLAGTFAVLAGGASEAPGLCAPPLVLGLVMFLWTPPHFWSFAILNREDYARAGLPMLPVTRGPAAAARFVLLSSVLLVGASLLPWLMGFQGAVYLAVAALSGAAFLALNTWLVLDPSPRVARVNFRASMAHLGCLLASVAVEAALL